MAKKSSNLRGILVHSLIITLTCLSVLYLSQQWINHHNTLSWLISLGGLFILIFSFTLILNRYYLYRIFYTYLKQFLRNIEKDPNFKQNKHSKELYKFIKRQKVKSEKLKLKEEFRREFLGNVAHELKTPLFSIEGYILALLDGAMDDREILKKYLQRSMHNIERINTIINDLDMITQFQNNMIQLHRRGVDFNDLLIEVVESLELKAENNQITIHQDIDTSASLDIQVDPDKIKQVLTNLIDNAIKYGKSGGHIWITVRHLKEFITVSIKDDGIGISQDDLNRIFERFYRVDSSRARKSGGSGLGLSIVKHILEAHNTVIKAHSIEEKGTTFEFRLPKKANFA